MTITELMLIPILKSILLAASKCQKIVWRPQIRMIVCISDTVRSLGLAVFFCPKSFLYDELFSVNEKQYTIIT